MPTDRAQLAADLRRLYELRPALSPHGLNVDASGNWDDADGRLLPDHIGDGAALMAIMENFQSGWFNRTIHGSEMGLREVFDKPMPPTTACCGSLLQAAVKAALSAIPEAER